jgi:IS30 family transposase
MVGTRLSVVERGKIEALWGLGLPIPRIAVAIGRDRTVVWRELRRNNSGRRAGTRHPGGSRDHRLGLGGVYRWSYSASAAQTKTVIRRRRPKPRKLVPGYGQPRPLLAELGACQVVCVSGRCLGG